MAETSSTRATLMSPEEMFDLGCGTGHPVCAAFADAGHDVLGIDVSRVMLDDARTKVPHAKFLKADAFLIDLPPDTYDAVTVYFSIAAGSTQDTIKVQFQRIYGWLRPGGVLVMATVPNSQDSVSSSFLGRPFLGSGLSTEMHVAHLKKLGFEIVYHAVSSFRPRAAELGICRQEEVKEEAHLFVYARKGSEFS